MRLYYDLSELQLITCLVHHVTATLFKTQPEQLPLDEGNVVSTQGDAVEPNQQVVSGVILCPSSCQRCQPVEIQQGSPHCSLFYASHPIKWQAVTICVVLCLHVGVMVMLIVRPCTAVRLCDVSFRKHSSLHTLLHKVQDDLYDCSLLVEQKLEHQ